MFLFGQCSVSPEGITLTQKFISAAFLATDLHTDKNVCTRLVAEDEDSPACAFHKITRFDSATSENLNYVSFSD